MHATTEVENADSPVPRDELAQRQVDRLALRPGADQSLRLVQHLVVDIDVRTHTPHHTPYVV